MGIDPSQPFSHQGMALDEDQHFFMPCNGGHRQLLKKTKDRPSILQISACQFPDDPWVTEDMAFMEQRFNSLIAVAQMLYPY